MFTITYPELVHVYHRTERPAPRQVVEPSAGVWGRTTYDAATRDRRKMDSEGSDFYSVFSKAMERNLT